MPQIKKTGHSAQPTTDFHFSVDVALMAAMQNHTAQKAFAHCVWLQCWLRSLHRPSWFTKGQRFWSPEVNPLISKVFVL